MVLENECCDHCGQVINDNDLIVIKNDPISKKDEQWISLKTCLKCRSLIREEQVEMSGDYSPLHPEETTDDFEDHENREYR